MSRRHREAEIGYAGARSTRCCFSHRDQNIFRLNVAVNDSFRMTVFEGIRNLDSDIDDIA